MADALTIYDSVAGNIGLTDCEKELVNTATFQRLRNIKHLGLASMVFPNANHTRFSHSLGTLSIMERFCRQLEINEDAPMLRAAALLHDIGHYPLSHVGEQAYFRLPPIESEEVLEEERRYPPTLADIDDQDLLQYAADKISNPWAKHERLSALAIAHRSDIVGVLEKHELDPEKIAGLVQATYTDNRMHASLISSEFDVDRLDYLLRDASSIGTTYGMIDLEYLLNTLTSQTMPDGTVLPVFKYKGLEAVDHFFMGRFFMREAIVFHKVVACYEVMAKALILLLIRAGLIEWQSQEDIETLMKNSVSSDFLRFDDAHIQEGIRQLQSSDDGFAAELADMFISRRHLKTAYEVKIMDPGIGEELPPGEPGELCARGPCIMLGYYEDEEKTAEVVDEEGWFRTGDLAEMDDKGYFKIVGRIKEMIITGGNNVYPSEVETLLLKHEVVKEVQVIGVPDDLTGEVVMAYIIVEEGKTCSKKEIQAFCKERTANYKVPRYIHFVDSFPISAAGKVLKKELKERAIKEMPKMN